jgi:hypothetical protein
MKQKINSFRQIVSRIKNFAIQNPPSKTILFIADETGITKDLGKSEEEKERMENIKELSALASRYDQMFIETDNAKNFEKGLEKLLEDTSLVSDQDADKEEVNAVRLMTVHASKGLEFSYVFITGLEEGLFPHDRDEDQNVSEEEAEEERRLFYVAVTRAKKKLFLTYAQTRTIFGSREVNIPSEFILEIPDDATIDSLITASSGKTIDASTEAFLEAYEKLLIVVNPTKEKFKHTLMNQTYYELLRLYSNELEKENTVLFVMGFSFADEHICEITLRAANSNPTLIINIIAHSTQAKLEIEKRFGKSNIKNNNIEVIAPEQEADPESKIMTDKFKYDLATINKEILGQLLEKVNCEDVVTDPDEPVDETSEE